MSVSQSETAVAHAPVAVAPMHDEEWATPAPAGLIALAIACFCFFAMLTGRVAPTATPFLACWLIGGFIVQFCVGLIELREKNLTGGNVFLFFSAFFMLTTALKYIVAAFLHPNFEGHIDHRVDGWAWLVLALALLLWTPAYLKRAPKPLALLVLFLDVAVPMLALRDLEVVPKSIANPLAGWTLLAGGILGIYVATAIINNGAFGRKVLPMPGPFLK
jgi:uncharacterized protein